MDQELDKPGRSSVAKGQTNHRGPAEDNLWCRDPGSSRGIEGTMA